MKHFLLIAGLFFAANSNAALAPYWDSVNQVGAAINAAEISPKISGAITTVKNLGGLKYEIATDSCRVTIQLEAHAPPEPGPTIYMVKTAGKVTCEQLSIQ